MEKRTENKNEINDDVENAPKDEMEMINLTSEKSSYPELPPFDASKIDTEVVSELQEAEEFSRDIFSSKYQYYAALIAVTLSTTTLTAVPGFIYREGLWVFLAVYLVTVICIGFPIILLELSLGQYYATGVLTIWKSSPICKGIGILILTITSCNMLYYQMTSTHSLILIVMSTFSAELPWATCNNAWNTEKCLDTNTTICVLFDSEIHINNLTYVGDGEIYRPYDGEKICFITDDSIILEYDTTSSVRDFIVSQLLGSYDNFDGFSLPPIRLLYLLIVWVLVFLATFRGVVKLGQLLMGMIGLHYIILVIFLIYGFVNAVSFDIFHLNIYNLIDYYYNIPFQIVSTISDLGIGYGFYLTISSFSKFNNNCVRDAAMLTVLRTVTIIIGSVAMILLVEYSNTLTTEVNHYLYGGLYIFTGMPQLLLSFPWSNFWTALMFFNFLLVSLGHAMLSIQVIVTSLMDQWPQLRTHRLKVVSTIIGISFILNIIFICKGVLPLVEYISNIFGYSSLITICFFECLAVSVGFGHVNFLKNIKEMFGTNSLTIWSYWCWVGIAPTLLAVIYVSKLIRDSYFQYFNLTIIIGIFVSFFPLVHLMWIHLKPSTQTLQDITHPRINKEEIKNKNKGSFV